MKRLLITSILSLSALSLTGCASVSPPTQQQIESASYGALPDDYQAQIKNTMSAMLKDPYSAQYTFLQPFKGYSQDGAWAPSKGGVTYGWVAPVMVNAKNSYGGYTGAKRYVFMFSNSILYDVTGNDVFGRVVPINQ